MNQGCESSLRLMPISVGIMAYNEETTIVSVARAFLDQQTELTEPAELIVVASGCTDGTVEAVRELARHDARIRLLIEPRREGKLAAVRRFLTEAACEVVVIAGADTAPAPDLLDRFGRRMLDDPGIGMVGGQIVPVPGGSSPASRLHELLWELHHEVALISPKLGEIVAVRRAFVADLHDRVHCDEVAIEAEVMKAGGRLAYEPAAQIANRSPTILREYLYQRRRNRCLHMWATSQLHYKPATSSRRVVIHAVVAHLRRKPRDTGLLLLAGLLESVAELLARRDFRRGRDYRVWRPLDSARSRTEDAVVFFQGADIGITRPSGEPDRVGVVVVVFAQSDEEVARLVRALSSLTYPDVHIYLVFNNAERDGTRDFEWSGCPRITVLETGANLGFTGGANAGIRHALRDDCALVLLLNTDIDLLRPDLIERLKEPFVGDPLCGMVSPVITQAPTGTLIWYAGARVGHWSGIPRHLGLGRRYKAPPDPKARRTQVGNGCCVLISSEMLHSIGAFDDDYFAYFEEVDFSQRARTAGYHIYLWPEALVAHYKHGRSLSPTETYYMTRNSFVFIQKHMSRARLPAAIVMQIAIALPVYFVRADSHEARLQWMHGSQDGLRGLITGSFERRHSLPTEVGSTQKPVDG